jgi:hypothetical protein
VQVSRHARILRREVLLDEGEEHAVDPGAVAQVGLAPDALAREAGALRVRDRPLVERVDLELQAVVAELVDQVALQEPRGFVRDPPAAEARVDGEAADLRDPAALVDPFVPERAGALAVRLDHEPSEGDRVDGHPLELGRDLGATPAAAACEEGLDVVVVQQLD